MGLLPVFTDELREPFEFLLVVYPFIFGHLDIPWLLNGVDYSHACFVHQKFVARVVSEPEEALSTSYLLPERPVFLLGDECVEFLRIKRPALTIDKAGDVVFDGFGDILGRVLLGDPPLAYFCLFQIEPFFEDQLKVDVRKSSLKDVGLRVDPFDIGVYSSLLFLADQVSFIYNDQISYLQLI